ncbi:MAG: hypothetical protein QOH39_1829 [Verrucomicrobiota bacterium]|jgi:hypothetical protein
MAGEKPSLLAGRNVAPLSLGEINRVVNTFLGLDRNVNVRHEPGARTVFRVVNDDQSGAQYGEVIFGPDIYPGGNVIDPNSALSIDAAAAHELTHFYRWKDKAAIEGDFYEHIDEALTSLQAICRYGSHLNDSDKIQLVCDAIQRLQLFMRDHAQDSAGPPLKPAGEVAGKKGNLINEESPPSKQK